jgi:hypothetical protein
MNEYKDIVNSAQVNVATGSQQEITSSAEKFVKAVVKRNVFGKLPNGLKTSGVNVVSSGRFYDHGPDKVQLSPLAGNFFYEILNHAIYSNSKKFSDLINTHIVTVAPSLTDSKNMVLTVHFFQDKQQEDARGYFTPAYVSTELAGGVMSEFIDAIQKSPDLLEDFYQKTFVELDSQGGRPGMRRAKSDGFFLITGPKLEETSGISRYDERKIRTFFDSLKNEKHLYQHGPYGTGEAFLQR